MSAVPPIARASSPASDPGTGSEGLAAVAEGLDAAVFVFQDEANVYVNGAGARLTGYSVAELLGMRFWDVIDPEWRDRVRANGLARQRGEAVAPRYDVPIRTRDGERRWLEFSGRRTLWAGRPAVLGLGFDVTARVELETALRADERHYRSLFEHSPQAAFEEDFSAVRTWLDARRAAGEVDLAAYFDAHPEAVLECADRVRITDINTAALRLYGAEAKDALLGSLRPLLGGASAQALFRAELLAFGQGATVFEGETATATLAGQPLHVWIRCSIAPPHEQDWSKVFVSVQDVTAGRRAASALHDSEARYRALFEDMPAMYFTLDAAGTVLAVNRFGAHTLGWEPHELVGQPVLSVFHPDDRGTVLAGLETARADPARVASWEVRKVRRDGRVLTVRETVRFLEQEDGERVFLVLCEDVTERRQLERTVLEIAEAEARRFAHDLHDDLGQKLVGFAYQAEALARRLQARDPEAARLASELGEAAQHALAEVRQLARIVGPVDVSNRGLLAALEDLAAHHRRVFGIECRVTRDERAEIDEPRCANDLYRIAQEATNNAIRHGKARAVHIAIGVRAGRTVLSIRDDGVGLPPGAATRPGDRGAGAGGTTGTAGPGGTASSAGPCGMGLEIMRYRAGILGATLELHPGARGGVTVSVLLPRPAPPGGPA